MKKAIYPGSFDPVTIGHADIIDRASRLFDEVVVVIMKNPNKNPSFSEEERLEMIEKVVTPYPNVKVMVGKGLTVNVARELNAKFLVRGIRAVMDYEFELQQATANMIIAEELETVFFLTRPEHSFLSSSTAKQIAANGGDISKFIPKEIIELVKGKLEK